MEYNTDVFDIIRAKRPNMDIDELHLGYSICEIEQKIKNYCHIPKVPKALYYTWANMVLDLLDYENAYNSAISKEVDDTVESILSGNYGSIAMGDTSWKQGDLDMSNPTTKALVSHTANLDDLILNYTKDLNEFRRIW